MIIFEEETSSGYRARTLKNASADVTIAIALNFNTAGEKLTKSSVLQQGKEYVAIQIERFLVVNPNDVNRIIEALNKVKATSLNIAGNGIYTLKDFSQNQIDIFTYQLLKAVIESPKLKTKIELVRTGGQTGFDEAGAKASKKLKIPTLVLAPKGWVFRIENGQDVRSEFLFKNRFITLPK